MKRVANREEYSNVIARFMINNEDEDEDETICKGGVVASNVFLSVVGQSAVSCDPPKSTQQRQQQSSRRSTERGNTQRTNVKYAIFSKSQGA